MSFDNKTYCGFCGYLATESLPNPGVGGTPTFWNSCEKCKKESKIKKFNTVTSRWEKP